jgi:hypothetical protein
MPGIGPTSWEVGWLLTVLCQGFGNGFSFMRVVSDVENNLIKGFDTSEVGIADGVPPGEDCNSEASFIMLASALNPPGRDSILLKALSIFLIYSNRNWGFDAISIIDLICSGSSIIALNSG